MSTERYMLDELEDLDFQLETGSISYKEHARMCKEVKMNYRHELELEKAAKRNNRWAELEQIDDEE